MTVGDIPQNLIAVDDTDRIDITAAGDGLYFNSLDHRFPPRTTGEVTLTGGGIARLSTFPILAAGCIIVVPFKCAPQPSIIKIALSVNGDTSGLTDFIIRLLLRLGLLVLV